MTAGKVVDHDIDFASRQAVNGESCDVRLADPVRFKLRPERHQQQHPKCPNSVHNPIERFQAGWVGPMRILEDHQHRFLPR
jgi:hypothetical protein